jgi:transcriptional regulator with XRE-family HTH domain
MSEWKEFLNDQLKDPEVRKEWDDMGPEFAIVQAIIDARNNASLTQRQLSEQTGIAQADISRLENGNANPSLKTLKRLASAMGMTLKIEFLPNINEEQVLVVK